MVSYAIRRNCKNILLLYPNSQTGLNTPALFQIQSAMLAEKLNINVQNLDITYDNIHDADELIKERVKKLNPIF